VAEQYAAVHEGFASLPLAERELTVVVIDEQPMSWSMAYMVGRTELGNGIKPVELRMI